MKTIRTIADIEELKGMSSIPNEYVSVIESEFNDWFEAEGTDESPMKVEISHHDCMYHLEDQGDTCPLQKVYSRKNCD